MKPSANPTFCGWQDAIIRESVYGYAILRLEPDAYHLVEVTTDGRVQSVLPSEMPWGGGVWVAWSSDPSGVRYVSRPHSRHAAHALWRRHIQPHIEYLDRLAALEQMDW